jgi:hypothetical protein
LNRSLIILYLIIFGSYILWTRQPDYFDGEKYPATIQMVKDSATNQIIPKAFYSIGINAYSINVAYPLLSYQAGEKVTVIFESEHPSKASVYRFWGYWLHWEELIGSIIAAIVLFQIAVSITNNPTDAALKEQLDYTPEKKTKYD